MNDETTTRRCFNTADLRVIESKDGPAKISGLAVPYRALSEDLGGFREQFLGGSLGASFDNDIFVDVEHDQRALLTRYLE